MSDEQRNSKRAPVNIRIYFGKRSADRLGVVQDVSENGMRIRARKLYPVNTQLILHVEVPGQGMSPATGIIKRARMVEPAIAPFEPAEMGIVILEGNKKLEEMIRSILAEFTERRNRFRKEVQLEVATGDAHRLIIEYTQNLGDGGIFIVTNNPPARGTLVDAVLKLPPDGEEVLARCVAVHICATDDAAATGRLPGAGLRFMSFREGDEQKYTQYLALLRSNEN